MTETVYESCGYRVVKGKGNVFGATYDIIDPKGKKLTSVGSAQGYKRVIRKAAGLNTCECGHIPSEHRAAIAPSTYRKAKSERAVRIWQYCNQRAQFSRHNVMREFWARVSARVYREQFDEVRSPGLAARCCRCSCTLSPGQVAADIKRREREINDRRGKKK